ncbi:hypothetical protein LEP1GSC058_1894 [Leptospira fainei serovar Hurstbridge str. BUT 6]|uniref:Uncharacterized protein n=1 Tax=Leptospira fainei serovar Hurstbridge str. BUT 6 TaxID=1193011 RepID=S3UY76_9LEPT|nr:hypothetical protein [Leptospira fainei]EPG75376.1 hypothetical protein LEP1GSC058_1894 [Leptospira fainei serovar Hurstbridge str. BUT 6]
MRFRIERRSVLDEGDCPNPKQPGPKVAAILLLTTFLASLFSSPLLSLNKTLNTEAVQGYQNGGMEGALVGAASGAATGYARQFGVNVGVSYSSSKRLIEK